MAIDLLVFSSTGREGLVGRTLPRYLELARSGPFARTILSIDGEFDGDTLTRCCDQVDCLLVSRPCRGYFSNIRRGLSQVEAEYFFWAEDDWEVPLPPDWERLIEAFRCHPTLAQIRWPKFPYVLMEEKNCGQVEGVGWLQDTGYSFNPHIGRTSFVRDVVSDLAGGGHAGENVERAFSSELRARGYLAATLDLGGARCQHIGSAAQREASHYERHLVALVERSASGTEVTVAPRAIGPTPAVERSRYVELLVKSGFAVGATIAAAVAAPVSRQARAFIRSVWRYWMPVNTLPTYHGPTCKEARESTNRLTKQRPEGTPGLKV